MVPCCCGKVAQVCANKQSVALYERAVQIAKGLADEVRRQLTLEATLRMGELHLTVSELEAAADDFQQAAEIAEEAGSGGKCRSMRCVLLHSPSSSSNALKEHARQGERALDLAKATNFEYAIASAEAAIAMQRMRRRCRGSLDLVTRACHEV